VYNQITRFEWQGLMGWLSLCDYECVLQEWQFFYIKVVGIPGHFVTIALET